jgi:succinate dehydrogenase / fumarate reductase, membrane anchor subunit
MSETAPQSHSTKARIQTPLARVRGLGSARDGTGHFWQIRVTAIGALLLTPILLAVLVSLTGADHATVKRVIGHPAVAVVLLLMLAATLQHMRLGMQVIIEDYVHSEGSKLLLLMLNTFFTVLVGAACAFAVLKLSLGA